MSDERDNIVVLIDPDGEEMQFEHIDTFEVNGSNYVALIPLNEQYEYEDSDEDYYDEQEDDLSDEEEIVILKMFKDEEGEEKLASIEDEDEFVQVYEELKVRLEDSFDFVDIDYDDEDWNDDWDIDDDD